MWLGYDNNIAGDENLILLILFADLIAYLKEETG